MKVHRGPQRNAILQSMLGSDGEDVKQGQRTTQTGTPSTISATQHLCVGTRSVDVDRGGIGVSRTRRNEYSLEISENAKAASQATAHSELQSTWQCLSEQASKLTRLEAIIAEMSEKLTELHSQVRLLRGTNCQRATPTDEVERDERGHEAPSDIQLSGPKIAVLEQTPPCKSTKVKHLNTGVNSVQGRAGPEADVSEYEEGLKTLLERFKKRENLSDTEKEVTRTFLEHFKRSYSLEIIEMGNTIKGQQTTIGSLNRHIAQLQKLLEGRLETVKTANSALARSSSPNVLCISPPPPQQEPGRKTTAPILPRASPHSSARKNEVPCRSSTVSGSGYSRPATTPSKFADGPTSSCMKGQEAVGAGTRGEKRPFGHVENDGMIEDEKRRIVRSKCTR